MLALERRLDMEQVCFRAAQVSTKGVLYAGFRSCREVTRLNPKLPRPIHLTDLGALRSRSQLLPGLGCWFGAFWKTWLALQFSAAFLKCEIRRVPKKGV